MAKQAKRKSITPKERCHPAAEIPVRMKVFSAWVPPDTLVHLSACYHALCKASDAVIESGHWRRADGVDEIDAWSDALMWMASAAVKTAENLEPKTRDEVIAKREILVDYHIRCGDGTASYLRTLSSLAVEELEVIS